MSDFELALVSVDSFPAPALIARAGPTTRKKFFEFFTVPIRNAHTRAAYYRAIQLAEIDDPAKREELLQAMAHGSAAAWGHLNLLGEYDFSEDKLQDSVGIKPPKLTD